MTDGNDPRALVMFVDDDEDLLCALQRKFRRSVHGVVTANSPETAMERLRGDGHCVAAVFADQYMPHGSGTDLLYRIREVSPFTVRGLMTGRPDLALAQDAVNSGIAEFFVVKPFREGELERVVKNALEAYGKKMSDRRTLESIRAETLLDPLTGLGNRRYLEEHFRRMISSAGRRRESFAVLFLDIDNFKAINDGSGHDAGDDVLREVSGSLRRTCRAHDVVTRFGGDEFVILMERASVDDAAALLRRIGKIAMRTERCAPVREITLSAGIAMFPDDGSDEDELLHAADAAMYRRKCQKPKNIDRKGT